MPGRRPHITLAKQLETALLQLGLEPGNRRLDHRPPLALRDRTPDGGYIPAYDDPRFMAWLTVEGHHRKTFGTKATTAGSDIHRIAKSKRLAEEQDAFRRRVLAREPDEKRKPSGRVASRGFDKTKTKKFNGKTVERSA